MWVYGYIITIPGKSDQRACQSRRRIQCLHLNPIKKIPKDTMAKAPGTCHLTHPASDIHLSERPLWNSLNFWALILLGKIGVKEPVLALVGSHRNWDYPAKHCPKIWPSLCTYYYSVNSDMMKRHTCFYYVSDTVLITRKPTILTELFFTEENLYSSSQRIHLFYQ